MQERCEDVRSAAAALRCAPQGLLSVSPLIFLGLFSHPPRAAAIIGFHGEVLQEKTCYWIYSARWCLFRRRCPSECLGCAELWWKLMVDPFKLLLRQPESLLCFPGTV